MVGRFLTLALRNIMQKKFNGLFPLMSYITRYSTHDLLMKPKPLQLKSKTSKEYRQVITIKQYLPNFLIFCNKNRTHI